MRPVLTSLMDYDDVFFFPDAIDQKLLNVLWGYQ